KRKAAKEFLGKVKAHIETLTDNPRKGRLSHDGNRELIHKGYTIPYLVDDESIVILGIFNQNEWIPKDDQGTSN
ncbi:MAG: type II toxin-antitoxin system RelE/ParE family toxin, partial [Sulfuricurvum sp.]|nr:type II toxin-antitoxin system RelE/ParE family toxin [Sulfuricurvum sp.]